MKLNFAPRRNLYGFANPGGLNRTLNQFDPTVNAFDPNYFNDSQAAASERSLAMVNGQVDITVANSAAVGLTAELFNYNNSALHKQNTTYAVGDYDYIPADSFEGLNALIAGYAGGAAPVPGSALGTIGWLQNGSCAVNGLVGDPTLTIQCQQLSYRSLFNSTSSTPFRILGVRLKVTDQAQFSNPLVWFKQTFMGGKKENQINPLAQVDPTQFQDKIVDIPLDLTIDAQSGIYTYVNDGVTLTMNVRVSAYSSLTV